jgi:CheY-like chemotaxis protein
VSELSVLLLGSTDRPEFLEARKALEGLARVIPAPDLDAACAVLAPGDSTWAGLSETGGREQVAVDMIAVAQVYPGQFSGEAMERLARLAPLARVVGLLGSWCEGEARSGQPWPGAVRVYWHQWPARCHQELRRMEQGLCCSWCLPPTATDEERLLALADQPLPRREGLIAIYSPSFDMRDWLSQACRRAGYATVAAAGDGWRVGNRNAICHKPATTYLPPPVARHAPPVQGARAALFDAFDCRGDELEQIGRLAAVLRPAPVIVLMSFPRVEDRDRVLAAGAAALLSKPVALEDLYWQIEECKVQNAKCKMQNGDG